MFVKELKVLSGNYCAVAFQTKFILSDPNFKRLWSNLSDAIHHGHCHPVHALMRSMEVFWKSCKKLKNSLCTVAFISSWGISHCSIFDFCLHFQAWNFRYLIVVRCTKCKKKSETLTIFGFKSTECFFWNSMLWRTEVIYESTYIREFLRNGKECFPRIILCVQQV